MMLKSICLTALLICSFTFHSMSQSKKSIEVGDPVPSFTLKDQNGETFDSKDYLGKKKLVIYFYPKDESSVCTKEACAFRDSYEDFKTADAMVIGINSGTSESHLAFQKHHNLPFTLLSDPDNKVLKLFGVKDVMFLTGRETFVADLNGKVVFKFKGMLKGDAHSSSVLAFLKKK